MRDTLNICVYRNLERATWFTAASVEWPGVASAGATMSAALHNFADAVALLEAADFRATSAYEEQLRKLGAFDKPKEVESA